MCDERIKLFTACAASWCVCCAALATIFSLTVASDETFFWDLLLSFCWLSLLTETIFFSIFVNLLIKTCIAALLTIFCILVFFVCYCIFSILLLHSSVFCVIVL